MRRAPVLTVLFAAAGGFVISAVAQEHSPVRSASGTAAGEKSNTSARDSSRTHDALPSANAKATSGGASEHLEGEERFHTNCGRCHQPPHKFPPRVMATAIRHMRVRAMITDEDMRLILRYMTE
jgi:mono/diheme cytochrome c family protein